jgi:hypothetical protein
LIKETIDWASDSQIHSVQLNIASPGNNLTLGRVSDGHASRKFFQPVASNTNVFHSLLLLRASLSLLRGLNLQHITVRIRTLATRQRIHSLLQSIALPAKEVIAMLTIPSATDDQYQ